MLVRRLFLLSFIGVIGLLAIACSGEKSIPAADSVDSLSVALKAAGLKVNGPKENGVLASRFFSIPGVSLTASGETILAYEFESEEAAAADRSQVSPDGWGIGPKYINWRVAPSYYSNGRLIVIYDGDKELVKQTLSVAMGERFAGSDPA